MLYFLKSIAFNAFNRYNRRDSEGKAAWLLTDVSGLRLDAAICIAAVQDRLEANRRTN